MPSTSFASLLYNALLVFFAAFRRQAPWKLILQFWKIILITIQILVFGQFRYAHTNYYNDNHIAFEHLFLKDWDSVREINAYPPSTGQYALYKKETFYQYFDYTAETYSQLENLTIVPTFRNSTLHFCLDTYATKVADAYRSLEDAYEGILEILALVIIVGTSQSLFFLQHWQAAVLNLQ